MTAASNKFSVTWLVWVYLLLISRPWSFSSCALPSACNFLPDPAFHLSIFRPLMAPNFPDNPHSGTPVVILQYPISLLFDILLDTHQNVCNKHISRHFTPVKTFSSNLPENTVNPYCVTFHCSLNSSVSGPVVLFVCRVLQTAVALYKIYKLIKIQSSCFFLTASHHLSLTC